MILPVCATRDTATMSFGRPFFVNHVAQAVRSFTDEVNNPESQLFKHSQDFELWELGSWDDDSGLFSSSPTRVIRATDVKKEI